MRFRLPSDASKASGARVENAQWVAPPAIRLPVLQTSEDENAFGPQAWSVMFL